MTSHVDNDTKWSLNDVIKLRAIQPVDCINASMCFPVNLNCMVVRIWSINTSTNTHTTFVVHYFGKFVAAKEKQMHYVFNDRLLLTNGILFSVDKSLDEKNRKIVVRVLLLCAEFFFQFNLICTMGTVSGLKWRPIQAEIPSMEKNVF